MRKSEFFFCNCQYSFSNFLEFVPYSLIAFRLYRWMVDGYTTAAFVVVLRLIFSNFLPISMYFFKDYLIFLTFGFYRSFYWISLEIQLNCNSYTFLITKLPFREVLTLLTATLRLLQILPRFTVEIRNFYRLYLGLSLH